MTRKGIEVVSMAVSPCDAYQCHGWEPKYLDPPLSRLKSTKFHWVEEWTKSMAVSIHDDDDDDEEEEEEEEEGPKVPEI